MFIVPYGPVCKQQLNLADIVSTHSAVFKLSTSSVCYMLASLTYNYSIHNQWQNKQIQNNTSPQIDSVFKYCSIFIQLSIVSTSTYRTAGGLSITHMTAGDHGDEGCRRHERHGWPQQVLYHEEWRHPELMSAAKLGASDCIHNCTVES